MSAFVDFDPFAGPAVDQAVAATESQREIWAAVQMGGAGDAAGAGGAGGVSAAYNESITLQFLGRLDTDALRLALEELMQRHESLRSTFSPDGDLICIQERIELPLETRDLASLAPSEARRRIDEILAEEVGRPFDLEHGPLVRFRLLRLADDEHWLTITAHHIICDGWSMGVVLEELAALYAANREGGAADLPPACRFSDYARLLESPEAQATRRRDLEYWRGRLAGPLPVLELPTIRSRPPQKSFEGERLDFDIPPDRLAELKRAASRCGASLFATLLTAFHAFLYRLTEQADLIVGIPAAGQATHDMRALVGHCVNLLPVRAQIDAGMFFHDLLRRQRGLILDDTEHQGVAFGTLVAELNPPRDPSRLPIVSVLFNLEQAVTGEELRFPGLDTLVRSNPRSSENFELSVNAAIQGNRLVLECQFNTDLFDRAVIAEWMESYAALLDQIARDPERPIGSLGLLSQGQQERMLVRWNDTTRPYPSDKSVEDLFAEQARLRPENLAARCEDQSLTYGELDRLSDRLARELRSLGVGPGGLVGLAVERSPWMLVGLLGILKSGAGYVPLDPEYPSGRLEWMMADSGMETLVVSGDVWEKLPAFGGRVVQVEQPNGPVDPPPLAPIVTRPDDVAYVIYTSGSTGRPKGVRVPRAAVVNFLSSMRECPGIGADDIVLAVTTLSFDIAVLELLGPLVVGGCVVIADRETAADAGLLAEAIERHGVTLLQATPSTWRGLVESGWSGSVRLKALCGGEALPRDLVAPLLGATGELWNMYGPTETTVWSTCHRVTAAEAAGGPILIGTPIANTKVYVLDARLEPVPVGVPGDLYIGGAGATLGYLNRPELTDERFIENPFHDPFAEVVNPRLYRTGDRARFHPGGELECLGRADGQVKIRGHRIELGEIESALSSHPKVRQAVARVDEPRPGDACLTVHVAVNPGATMTATEARRHLRMTLPEYMIPRHVVFVDELPLTANGKIDRTRLAPLFEASPVDETSARLPETADERLVAELWRQALSLAVVGLADNFFNLGGHSLLAMRVVRQIEERTGVRIPPRALVTETLAQIAGRLESAKPAANGG